MQSNKKYVYNILSFIYGVFFAFWMSIRWTLSVLQYIGLHLKENFSKYNWEETKNDQVEQNTLS